MYDPFLTLISDDVEINPGPRHNSDVSFLSATGILIGYLLTITQSYFL